MAEEKFDPVKEFVHLRDTLGRRMEKQIRNIAGIPNTVYPPVDIYETEDAVLVRTIFLHGQKPEGIEISMENGILELSGETTDPFEIEESTFIHRELNFGAFARTIEIPRSVKADEASASFKDGILTIKLPKRDRSQIVNITPTD